MRFHVSEVRLKAVSGAACVSVHLSPCACGF